MTPRVRGGIALALVAGGVLVWLVGLLADQLGVGGVPGFNWKQVVLAELGIAAVLLGVLWISLVPHG